MCTHFILKGRALKLNLYEPVKVVRSKQCAVALLDDSYTVCPLVLHRWT